MGDDNTDILSRRRLLGACAASLSGLAGCISVSNGGRSTPQGKHVLTATNPLTPTATSTPDPINDPSYTPALVFDHGDTPKPLHAFPTAETPEELMTLDNEGFLEPHLGFGLSPHGGGTVSLQLGSTRATRPVDATVYVERDPPASTADRWRPLNLSRNSVVASETLHITPADIESQNHRFTLPEGTEFTDGMEVATALAIRDPHLDRTFWVTMYFRGWLCRQNKTWGLSTIKPPFDSVAIYREGTAYAGPNGPTAHYQFNTWDGEIAYFEHAQHSYGHVWGVAQQVNLTAIKRRRAAREDNGWDAPCFHTVYTGTDDLDALAQTLWDSHTAIGLTDTTDRLNATARLVQYLDYKVDQRKSKLPLSTLADTRGDCSDKTFLFAALTSRAPYETRGGYLYCDLYGTSHLAYAVDVRDLGYVPGEQPDDWTTYTFPDDAPSSAPDTEYAFVELTAPRDIGDQASGYSNEVLAETNTLDIEPRLRDDKWAV